MQFMHDMSRLFGLTLVGDWWSFIIAVAVSVVAGITMFQSSRSTYMSMYIGIMMLSLLMMLLVLSPPLWLAFVVSSVLCIGLCGRILWVGRPAILLTPRLKKRQWSNLWNEVLDRAHL